MDAYEAAGMHQNAYSYAKLDPEKRARMVTGWSCDTAIPRPHSVIERDGQMVCITPGPFEVLTFRPDPASTIKAANAITALLDGGAAPDDIPDELLASVGAEKITPG